MTPAVRTVTLCLSAAWYPAGERWWPMAEEGARVGRNQGVAACEVNGQIDSTISPGDFDRLMEQHLKPLRVPIWQVCEG